jgi:hypothetical protein
MALELTGNPREIAQAIDSFPAHYHADYARVRDLGRVYLSENPVTPDACRKLARSLRCVLESFGAGRRKAPKLRGEDELTAAFLHQEARAGLVELGKLSLANLRVIDRTRRIRIANGCEPHATCEFDRTLLRVLHRLSEMLFVNNTNLTYPMKALLLVSGLMPAFDSQVRKGLRRVGFCGMGATQFTLPPETQGANRKKVTCLPFVLGECWAEFGTRLREGAEQSRQRRLANEPGRLFDVLFFMHAKEDQPCLFQMQDDKQPWYALR